jgi:Leucine-rich repeat (LRR) protein
MLEFYVGNNQISSVKELCGLKNLPKLIILDVSGNELWRDAGYRKYAIFHLKKLKVLDSVSID